MPKSGGALRRGKFFVGKENYRLCAIAHPTANGLLPQCIDGDELIALL